MYVLGNHPEAQDRVLEELNEQIPNFGDKALSVRDLNNLEYLDRLIKEVLRLYPSVPFIGRQIYEPFTVGKYKNIKFVYIEYRFLIFIYCANTICIIYNI